MDVITYTLRNGLRVLLLPSASPVVYCGYEINVGTRHEPEGSFGLAHFCEHMSFKGTQRRRAWHIANALERVGGDLEAYTSKEDTVYYAAVMSHDLDRAIDVLSDMVFHSTYPQREIDKEVEVICDEINSYEDSPSELIYDDFENLIFPNKPLGHNILGTTDSVRSFTTGDALRFTRQWYRPDNAIFYASGDFKPERVMKLLERATAGFPDAEPYKEWAEARQPLAVEAEPLFRSVDRQTHQAHVVVGCPAKGVHEDHLDLQLLNNILGGPGKNARLNLALREHNGLVYTVESGNTYYRDAGLWTVYFGCDPHDVDRCLRLVQHELQRLVDEPLSAQQLRAAKQQWKGQTAIVWDNRQNFAMDCGQDFLHLGQPIDIADLYRRIDALTSEQLLTTARRILAPGRMSRLLYLS